MHLDDNPLTMSPRVRVDVRDSLFTLNIQNAVVEDSGVYRVLVRNPYSDITSECTVNVFEGINKAAGTPPLFTSSIKGMSLRVIFRSEPHHLSLILCQSSGLR